MDRNPIILLLVGPPGSGKSSFADKYIKENPSFAYINQDTQGRDGHLQKFNDCIKNRQDILVDRMNFSKSQRRRYLDPAKKANYYTKIMVFHVPYSICLERASERVGHPTIKDAETAEKAIYGFFKSYVRVEDDEVHEVERVGWDREFDTKVVVCDLDGTLADCRHRLHHIKVEKPNKPNWKKFFDEMPLDPVNEWCRDLLHAMSQRHQIIYCTGRAGEYYDLSKKWLEENSLAFPGFKLFSRLRGDHRPDWQVKEIIYEFEIKPRYDILFVVDDRQQVVDMWRKHGVTVLQCAKGDF